MAHLIESIDRVYSNKGKEWHGKARFQLGADGAPVPSLTREHLKDVLFPIVELPDLYAPFDGSNIALPGKAVAADLRARGEGIRPLAIHTDAYRVIENSAIFEALENAMKDTPHSITSAGTLDGAKRFFLTVELAQHSLLCIPGEEWKAFLCFSTSHDGTLALRVYDSATRIVCNNTLNMSWDGRGKFALRIKHSAGAQIQIDNFPAFLDSVLKGREEFSAAYARLMESRCAKSEAFAGLIGKYWEATGKPTVDKGLSTRTENTIQGIMHAYENGKGNNGQTFADLLNGVTEYYTSGAGTGAKADSFEKRIAANFGSPAERKTEFASLLMATDKDGAPNRKEWTRHVEAGNAWLSGIERNRAASGNYGQRRDVASNGAQLMPTASTPVASVQDGAGIFADLLNSPLSR